MRAAPMGERLDLLQSTLAVAVPLWIEQIRPNLDFHLNDVKALAQTLHDYGDVILYPSHRKGETAAAFTALARGMAILSFVPGGVRAFGLHFESKK